MIKQIASPALILAASAEALTLPDPRGAESVGWYLVVTAVVLGALLAGAYYLVGIMERWQNIKRGNSPQQRNVNIQEPLRTIKDCDRIHAAADVRLDLHDGEFKLVRSEMTEMEQRLASAGEERASRIHKHIESVNQNLQDDMKAFPDRMFALLRNAGVIKNQ